MTKQGAASEAPTASRGSRPYLVLGALVAGLLAGMAAQQAGDGIREPLIHVASYVGGIWLDALKMTVIPLIVALLVVGIAGAAEAAKAGRIAGRSILWFVIVCTASAIFGAVMMVVLTSVFPLPEAAGQALRTGLSAIDATASAAPIPNVSDFFRGIVPANVVAAANNGDVLPLVVFTVLFALALARIAEAKRRSVVGFFDGTAEALLVVISWVLWVAPLGVFALGFALGASAGGAAFAGLAHYIVLVSLIGVLVTLWAYPLALLGGRSLGAFVRAMIAPQSVAISTRSSLASLPAMLDAARVLDVKPGVADVTLPMSVALFRATGPAMNVAVAFYVAHWLGFHPGLGAAIAATAVASVISYGAVSLPGEVSFISSIAPIAMALGVPIAPLALLVAVEMVPDIFRTLGNVTLDVAAMTVVDRGTGAESAVGQA
ncbi:MAG TPA: cation:dicarboxylase symporter family transporter [Sphingomicrobium sp.]